MAADVQAGALDASAALSENVEAEGFLLNRFYIHIMFEVRVSLARTKHHDVVPSISRWHCDQKATSHGPRVKSREKVFTVSADCASPCATLSATGVRPSRDHASQVLSPLQQARAEVAASPYPTDVVVIGNLLQQDAAAPGPAP